MAIDWWRSYHGAPTDPKWLAVAARAKVPAGVVSAVWFALEDHASQAEDRGSVADFDVETYAAFAGWGEEDVARVIAALESKQLIEDGRLSAWERRQPKREDPSTDRVRAFRERKRDNATPGNAVKREETVDESREEEKREEKNNPPVVPPGADAPAPKKKAAPSRGSRLPDAWQPNEGHRALAESRGVDMDAELEQFRDHARATGRVMKDWDATFRTWIRKAQAFQRRGPPGSRFAGTEAERARSAEREPTIQRTPSAAETMARINGEALQLDRERANRARVDAWSKANEERAAAIWAEVEEHFADNPMLRTAGLAKGAAEAEYRRRVLALLESEAA